jgi:nitroreductase
VVIRERETLDAIPAIHPHSKMLHEAPLAVLVCGDPALEKHSGYWIQDCSACVQNMLLEAAALGLGGCWLGVYPREERISGLRALLGIPAGVVPFALVALGHSAVEQKEVDRFRTERVHYGRW